MQPFLPLADSSRARSDQLSNRKRGAAVRVQVVWYEQHAARVWYHTDPEAYGVDNNMLRRAITSATIVVLYLFLAKTILPDRAGSLTIASTIVTSTIVSSEIPWAFLG